MIGHCLGHMDRVSCLCPVRVPVRICRMMNQGRQWEVSNFLVTFFNFFFIKPHNNTTTHKHTYRGTGHSMALYACAPLAPFFVPAESLAR